MHAAATVDTNQDRVRSDLLGLGEPRPPALPHAAAAVAERLTAALGDAAGLVPDGDDVWVTKARVAGVLRCEGQYAASRRAAPTRGPVPDAVAKGLVAHRALRVAHTHPERPAAEYVEGALASVRASRPDVEEWWASLEPADASEVINGATLAVEAFVQDWPPMPPSWNARFEVPMRAQVGALLLVAQPDLVLGRPRSDMAPSMAVVDFKSSANLSADHSLEADFYAVVATLRTGVAPRVSAVYSLPTGHWTHPAAVSEERLMAAADTVGRAARRMIELEFDGTTAALRPGGWCRWCPAATTCPEASL